MKQLLLLVALALLSYRAAAQDYDKLPSKYYGMTVKEAPAYRNLADTTKGVVKVLQADGALVVGRLAPKWAVVKKQGFEYFMPARYLVGFSADPAGDAALLAAAVPKTEEYCVLHMQGNNVQIDYGQRMRLRDKETDQYGNKLNFNSAADALNYMNSKGWELVSAYTGAAITEALITYPATFFIMRRRIQR